MHLSFHGAAREVTGSAHLLEVGDAKVLVDCGMFQGRDSGSSNRADLAFDPSEVDVILLTHAHLDHCGRLPLLAKRGFRGEIVCTAATRELARIVLLDAAKIQEEDARRRSRRQRRQGQADVEPLFDMADAALALDRFGRTATYGQPMELTDGIEVTFQDAGHILGSAWLDVHAQEGGKRRHIVFSGDLGNSGKPIVRDPTPPPENPDVLIMETTYGNRNHRSLEQSVQELYEVINDTIDRGGNVLVPSFALERSQDMLYFMREGIEAGELPGGLEVFLDSPMAISATDVFRRHPECYDAEARGLLEGGTDPFRTPRLTFTRDPRDSMEINHVRQGAVIVAGAGMLNGGRMLHHLKHNLWRPECSLVFVSFAVPGTLARMLIDGVERVKVMGEEIQVGARIHTINGFSAHAGRDELLAWRRAAGDVGKTLLVHGEESVMRKFANGLVAQQVDEDTIGMPKLGERVAV